MGMSGSTYMSRANEITKQHYYDILATGNRDKVYKIERSNGTYKYTTYHRR